MNKNPLETPPEIVKDSFVDHVSYGLIGLSTHGGIKNGVTVFVTGECYSGTASNPCPTLLWPNHGSAAADYSAYSNYVTTTGVSGDSDHLWIAVTSSFFYHYMYSADFPESNSLFYASACRGAYQTDMMNAILASGASTYLGWSEDVHVPNPGHYAYNTFMDHLTNGETAQSAYDAVGLNKDDWLYPWAHLGLYGSGSWTRYYPNVYVQRTTTSTVWSTVTSYVTSTVYTYRTSTVYSSSTVYTTVYSTTVQYSTVYTTSWVTSTTVVTTTVVTTVYQGGTTRTTTTIHTTTTTTSTQVVTVTATT